MAIKVTYRARSNKNLVTRGKEQLRAQVPKIAKRRLKAAAEDLKKRMSTPGKRVKYPIQWTNEAQKRKVLRMLRRGNKLPYKRTGVHARGWKVVVMKLGYAVENKVRGSGYLYGDLAGKRPQVRMHAKNWKNVARQAEIVMNRLPETVRAEMAALARKLPNK